MSAKTLLISAPLGLGALVLLWASIASRTAPEAAPARPGAKSVAPEVAAAIEAPASAASRPVAPAAPAGGGGEHAVIEGRIRLLEERLLSLETKRNELLGANQDLQQQIVERNAEASARAMAEFRVRTWEQLLGLSETQKQALLDLVTRWHREDAGKPASRDTWLARESELRSRLTVEQSAKLHESSVAQGQAMWNHLGRTIGSMVGAPKEDQARFQQALGDFRPANAMLLPEGYGADWAGMMREGSSRLQPVLSADQMAKLNRFVQK